MGREAQLLETALLLAAPGCFDADDAARACCASRAVREAARVAPEVARAQAAARAEGRRLARLAALHDAWARSAGARGGGGGGPVARSLGAAFARRVRPGDVLASAGGPARGPLVVSAVHGGGGRGRFYVVRAAGASFPLATTAPLRPLPAPRTDVRAPARLYSHQ